MSVLSKRRRYQMLWGQLEAERSSFISHWRELNDYILPRRGRFTLTEGNRGERRSKNVIDSTATFAARTLSSGMMSGVTSPARPWFRLTTPDPELAEFASVKSWLHTVSQRMQTVLLRSNTYNALPILYQDMGVFGTGVMLVEEDDEDFIRCRTFPIGSYVIANDAKGRVRVFMRQFRMTVRQIVEQFGGDDPSKPDWTNISTMVKNHWDRKDTELWIDVVHAIAPNREYDPNRIQAKYKPFTSCYYEAGGSDDKLLDESGFDEFPVLSPRWSVTGEDVYGTDCPGMTTLGDVKQLQFGEKKQMQAIEKSINPPMIAPTGLRNVKASLLPGDITYWDSRSGAEGFRPVHEIRPNIQELEHKQEQCRSRIRRGYFEDLFLMLAYSDGSRGAQPITAREIEERHEEKFLALGPVLEQLNQELLNPLIDRIFAIMLRRGLIPEAPEELQGAQLKVEYISIMAQAQKRIGLASINEFAGFVGSIAQMDPSVLDKIDRDQMIDEYGEMTGVPPRIIVSDEDVMAIRQQRAEAQQAETQAAQIEQMSKSAKNLATSPTEGGNALSDVLAAAQASGSGLA